MPAGVPSADLQRLPERGDGPWHEHQRPVGQAGREQDPARSAPVTGGQAPVGEKPQAARDQDETARPGRLERESQAAERQRAAMEPVIKD